jgi:predicted phosphoadenosine phosphosulfate sulfurtransferase
MKEHWLTNKQIEQLNIGTINTVTRVNHYVGVWESRCYSDGRPDEIEVKLMRSMRAPCYKALALAILKNDGLLTSCGYKKIKSQYEDALRNAKIKRESKQLELL